MKIRVFSDLHIDINQSFPFPLKTSEKDIFTRPFYHIYSKKSTIFARPSALSKPKKTRLPVAVGIAKPLDYLVSVGNEASKGIAVAHTRSARLVAFEVSLGKMIASARESAVE